MKGFALTIDALMALSLAFIMFIGILSLIPHASINNYNKKQLSNLGNDILSTMDTSERLSFYVDITLNIYSGNIGPPASFNLLNTYSNYTQNCEKSNDFVKVKRMFINYNQQRYGLAEFELWLG